jgi:hypothetical protein
MRFRPWGETSETSVAILAHPIGAAVVDDGHRSAHLERSLSHV